MNDMTVREVSRSYNVSTRMLRYYEKEGLITCKYREDYAYRMYDETAVRRLQQILLLRKLRIPLKQIKVILNTADQSETVSIFLTQISALEDEIASLKVIRDILAALVDRSAQKPLSLLENEALRFAVEMLPLSKNVLKEKYTMSDLNQANANMNRAENVRILLLPPCTVASYHYIGQDPEEKVGEVMSEFVQSSRLYDRKPDARMFGFNHPNPGILEGIHGYEDWVTIPEDMDVPKPLEKKHFAGGLYAVLTIPFPEFHLWKNLEQWVQDSEQYAPNYSEQGDEIMGGCLEEHLNWVYAAHMGWPENGIDGQIDLMLPVKKK